MKRVLITIAILLGITLGAFAQNGTREGSMTYAPIVLPPHGAQVDQDASYVVALALFQGWNWWSPTARVTAAQIRSILDTNLQEFKTKTGDVATDAVLMPGQMYKIKVSNSLYSERLAGLPSEASVSIGAGQNWIGFTDVATTGISATLATYGITPNNGDKILSQDQGFAVYNGTSWEGTLTNLVAGKGYVYIRF